MTGNRRTERLPQEVVGVNGATITIQPYILPHLSYITESETQWPLADWTAFGGTKVFTSTGTAASSQRAHGSG